MAEGGEVIGGIRDKHHVGDDGGPYGEMGCVVCQTAPDDPCDVQELSHYTGQLETARRAILTEHGGESWNGAPMHCLLCSPQETSWPCTTAILARDALRKWNV